MPVTNWICIKCGVTNPKTYFKCQTCMEPKPIFWECNSCKTKNPTASVKCQRCRRKRPAIFSNTVNIKGLSKVKFQCQNRSMLDVACSPNGTNGTNGLNPPPMNNVASTLSSVPSTPMSSISSVDPSKTASTFSGLATSMPSAIGSNYHVSSYDIFRK